MLKKRLFLFIFFLCGMFPFLGFAREEAIQSIFIPVFQNFDFQNGQIVDRDKGDITILHDGIETTNLKVDIAALKKGFIEDFGSLPPDAEVKWGHFADYEIGMIYAVQCEDGGYALFELIEVSVSGDDVLGIEIDYKYQPDGSGKFL